MSVWQCPVCGGRNFRGEACVCGYDGLCDCGESTVFSPDPYVCEDCLR